MSLPPSSGIDVMVEAEIVSETTNTNPIPTLLAAREDFVAFHPVSYNSENGKNNYES
jgi:hypothetical protein